MNEINNDLRKKILEKGRAAGLVHYSSAFSCLDFVAYLYDNVLKEEDTFILSKGHGAMALYAVLEKHGFNPTWQMHPDYDPKNGIMATSGSLGHGLPIGLGYALAKKFQSNPGRTFVLIGDGESVEGTNWEALSLANKFGVNLTVAVDWNKNQIGGEVKDISGIDYHTLLRRFEAFGCDTSYLRGHSQEDLGKIKTLDSKLNALILDTVAGKGVSFLEELQPHHYDLNKFPEQYARAIKELE